MNLPPFVYTKAFWEALSIFLSGLLALLAFFGVVEAEWAIPASAISAWIFSLLRMFGITPELQARLLDRKLSRAEKLLEQAAIYRNDLVDYKASQKSAKPKRK